jgi:hypothetical protein
VDSSEEGLKVHLHLLLRTSKGKEGVGDGRGKVEADKDGDGLQGVLVSTLNAVELLGVCLF